MLAAAFSIAIILAFAAGLILGHRRGCLTGQRETIHRLLLVKNPDMWDAAHFLAVDVAMPPEPVAKKP